MWSVEEVDQDGKVVRCVSGGYLYVSNLYVLMVLPISIQLFVTFTSVSHGHAFVPHVPAVLSLTNNIFKATNK